MSDEVVEELWKKYQHAWSKQSEDLGLRDRFQFEVLSEFLWKERFTVTSVSNNYSNLTVGTSYIQNKIQDKQSVYRLIIF